MFRIWSIIAAVLGAVGVAVAAWSTHGLPHVIPPERLPEAVGRAETANLHYMLHTLALLGVALWARQGGNVWLHVAGTLFLLGILGFAGGIYLVRLLAGIDEGLLIYIVPAGGTCLMLGWLALAVAGWRQT